MFLNCLYKIITTIWKQLGIPKFLLFFRKHYCKGMTVVKAVGNI